MQTPSDLLYSKDHEWVRRTEHEGRPAVQVGVTDFAQDALGDVVFVEVEPPGSTVQANEPLGEIESTKSVSDLFAPVSGEIVDRNNALDDQPQLVNDEPYGAGWICVIAFSDEDQLAQLLSAQDYEALVKDE